MNRRHLYSLILALAFPVVAVLACGPGYSPDVFIPAEHPHDQARFAKGQLGILQPGYWMAEKVVAYRYLTGGPLSPKEQTAYMDAYGHGYGPDEPLTPEQREALNEAWKAAEAARPVNRWIAARAAFNTSAFGRIDQMRTLTLKQGNATLAVAYTNCGDPAFSTAIATLSDRTRQWGAQSAELRDWVAGQDAVFFNCSETGKLPGAAPAGASRLLQQDRAYQTAAAAFYSMLYDVSIAEFEAIARDTSSPWSRWGEYLAARALVRKAAFSAPVGEYGDLASFDKQLLRDAASRLRRIAAKATDADVRHAAEAELGFIQVRLEPEAHLREVSLAIAGPKPDADFAQHLSDLRFLRKHGVTAATDLVQWIDRSEQSPQPLAAVKTPTPDLTAEWHAPSTTAWLFAALQATNRPDPALLDAAANVPADSPGFLSVNYHRVRLLDLSGKTGEARDLATQLLGAPATRHDPAVENAFHGLRMQMAESMGALLIDAPRTLISAQSEQAENAVCSPSPNVTRTSACVPQLPPLQFDQDAAITFNTGMPLARWVEAARDPALPHNLQQALGWAAWLRALLLDDTAVVKETSTMLPASVQKQAGDSTGFPATLALLRSPGFRPYLQPGVQRSVSYNDTEGYRDNWWCDPASGSSWTGGGRFGSEPQSARSAPPPNIAFLSLAEKTAAAHQRATLDALPMGVVWLGRRAIQGVQEQPERKENAEALALVVRATHFGCSPGTHAPEQNAVSREAFQILHRRYPNTEWAKKTRLYY